MPTATKLFSALFFAAVAGITAMFFALGLPDGMSPGRLIEVSVLIGAIVGWRWMGRRARRSYGESLGTGMVTSVLIFLWTDLAFSIVEMLERSMQMRYRDAFQAVLGVFDLMVYYGAMMVRPEAPIVLMVGGALGGLGAEFVSRRWS